MNKDCSAILSTREKLPQKFKDPGIFTISCAIGDLFVSRALSNLGASINLLPYDVFKKLGLR